MGHIIRKVGLENVTHKVYNEGKRDTDNKILNKLV